MKKLVLALIDSDIPKDIYIKKKDETMRTSLALEQQKKDAERGRKNWGELLREWILDTKQATFLSLSDNYSTISSKL